MKKILLAMLVLVLCACCCARAENAANSVLEDIDTSGLVEFAQDYNAGEMVEGILDSALNGNDRALDALFAWLKAEVNAPFIESGRHVVAIMPVILLLAFVRCVLPSAQGGSEAVLFLLRLKLILLFSNMAAEALQAASECLKSSQEFTGISAPLVALLLNAMGMEGTAALVSPAASLAGDMAAKLFSGYGLPLCKLGLCMAIAGSLSSCIRLDKISRLIRKTANWCAGLAVAVFTALLALQGSVAEGLDGIAVRTAKYAVDSASSIIGSGVSDAWESYVSGVLIAKNALGISGIAAIMAAAFHPMLKCLLSYLVLILAAAAMDVFGEKEGVSCAEQIAGICQMALSLCTGALAIAVILLGAAMSAGMHLSA